jgi:vacuolar-type H+-ATPase subunit E/Vma4
VGYGDLLRALEDEVREQARALREEARREGERIAEEGRRLSARAREEALGRVAQETAASLLRARVRAALIEERALLVEKRRLLEEVRAETSARLGRASSAPLTCRLLDEALADDEGGALVAVVDPGHAEAARTHARARHPDAADRLVVEEAPSVRGGVELRVGAHLVVDDTLPSRLARAWPALEVELASVLFGGTDGGA